MAPRARSNSTSGQSLYDVLDIHKQASPEDIRKAYRKLALRYHPDKNPDNPDATQRFQEVNYANRILSDVTKRAIYDRYGSLGLYLAEQLGDENVGAYYMLSSPWCKALVVVCGILTGCYCLCCCCCCCNFCCGKYKSHAYDEAADGDYANLREELNGEADDPHQPIIAQPGRGGGGANGTSAASEETTLPVTAQPSYGYDK